MRTQPIHIAPFCISRASRFSVLLRPHGCLNKFGPTPEISRATDLVGVVVVSASNDIEGLGWLGHLEDLSAQLNGDNVVFVSVNDQLWERELRKAIEQGNVCSK